MKNNFKILFDLKKEYYYSSFVSILKAFENDKRFDISFYVGKNDERIFKIFPVYHRRRIEKWINSQGYTTVNNPKGFDAVIAGDALRNPEKYGNALLFHSDHGPGTKVLRTRNLIKQKHKRYTVFLEGQYWMDVIKKLGYEEHENWVLTGVPKLDPLFWGNYYNRENILKKLNLDPDKKTVLFAPSYKPSCIPFIKDYIGNIAESHNLIIKLHPYSWGGKYSSKSQSKIYLKLAKKYPNIALIPKDDIDALPYVYCSDTVISDTSSVLAICLAVGKIGVIADFPYPKHKYKDGTPVLSEEPGEYLKNIFVHFNNIKDLENAVQKALFPSKQHKKKMLEYRDYYFTGLDGKAGERAKDIIVKSLINTSK